MGCHWTLSFIDGLLVDFGVSGWFCIRIYLFFNWGGSIFRLLGFQWSQMFFFHGFKCTLAQLAGQFSCKLQILKKDICYVFFVLCPRTFDLFLLQDHERVHQRGPSLGSQRPKFFKCSSCDKAFAKPSQLERHNRTHTGNPTHARTTLTQINPWLLFCLGLLYIPALKAQK
jgi:hypothetical protein